MSNNLINLMMKCFAIVLTMLVLFFAMSAHSYAQRGFSVTQVKVTKLTQKPALTFTIIKKRIQLAVGSSRTISASSSEPSNPSPVAYSSSDATIVSVDATGRITGVKVGVATISASQVAAVGFEAAENISYVVTVVDALTTTVALANSTLIVGQAAVNITHVTATGGAAPLTFAVSPALPAALSFDTTNGAITGSPRVPSPATTYTVTVSDANNATSSKTFSLTVNDVVSTTLAVPDAMLTVGQTGANVTPVTGAGGVPSLKFAINPLLPIGLNFDTTNGAITGSPRAPSAANYTVTVSDANNDKSSKTFSLTVNDVLSTTAVMASSTLTADQPSVFTFPVTAAGGVTPRTFAVSPALPDGLNFDTTNGAMTGSPTGALAATEYTVTVRDANNATSSKKFRLVVNRRLTATVNRARVSYIDMINLQQIPIPVSVTGGTGTGPFIYEISDALPQGMIFDVTNGTLSADSFSAGIIPSFSTRTYTVTITDANRARASGNFVLAY